MSTHASAAAAARAVAAAPAPAHHHAALDRLAKFIDDLDRSV